MIIFQNRNLIAPNRKELQGGLLCWVAFLFLPYLLILFPFFQENSLQNQFLFDLTVTVLCFLLVLIVFRNFLFRSRVPFLFLLMTCFFGFLGSQAIGNLWGLLLSFLAPFLPETPSNMNQELINSFLENYKGIMILNVVLFTPFIEELLLRGTIFAPLCKRSPFLAYAVSMTVFSALHVTGFIGMQHWSLLLFSFLQYLPAAFVLCWSYQRSQSIWAPICLHGILNLYSTILILS